MDSLSGEWVRGASWYLEKALEIVANSPDPVSAADAARRVRPGMGSLDFLYLVVRAAAERGLNMREVARSVATYLDDAKRSLDVSITKARCPRRVATVSFSRAVTRFLELKRSCVEVVYLAESKPGAEFAEALRTYSAFTDVVPIPDSAVGAFEYDAAVVGVDGYYLDAVLNKVGTLPLLAAARARGARTVAVFESYKAVPLASPKPLEVSVELGGRTTAVPIFDKISPRLFDEFITDYGIFRSLDPADLFHKALEKILNKRPE
ncbi:translation initiation factor eIF-2B [Pyrobaculum sp.]|uniref:translation initiation factor eIF-2B n=1 Tax=Pyrobaculum sp. TaxID=2004705 RepID=UPI003162CA12